MEKPGGLQFVGSQRVGHNCAIHTHSHTHTHTHTQYLFLFMCHFEESHSPVFYSLLSLAFYMQSLWVTPAFISLLLSLFFFNEFSFLFPH